MEPQGTEASLVTPPQGWSLIQIAIHLAKKVSDEPGILCYVLLDV
jgi:hypothetical protein